MLELIGWSASGMVTVGGSRSDISLMFADRKADKSNAD